MMIGKTGDIMAAQIVIGATDRHESASSPLANEPKKFANETKSVEELQDEWNAKAYQEAAEEPKEVEPMDEESVANMTKELNELMSKINCNLEFQYHKEVNLMSVRMIDKGSGDTIKELPPEEMIQNMINAKEWIGAFLDKNA